MKIIFLLLGLVIQMSLMAQKSKDPIEVTPEIQKKIKQDIEKQVPKLKLKLEKEKENSVQIEFILDTFRLEHFMSRWLALDYRDFGMRDAGYETARLYDSLLNKYYKKLQSVLKGDDKKILVQAQKAWLAYRDNETKLVETISKEEYAGGGTMQGLTEASEYLDLIKTRIIVIFEHYVRATQSE